MSFPKLLPVLLVLCAAPLAATEVPALRVLPWAGHHAAVSLTFDDALPVHLDVAVPALRERHLNATFFLIASKTTRLDEWIRAAKDGNEIGNHSFSHENAKSLNEQTYLHEVEGAQTFFREKLGVETNTYAYPYAVLTKQARDIAIQHNFLARGWQSEGTSPYLVPGCGLDWWNVPSLATHTSTTPAEVRSWIDTALARSAWLVVQIHGIGNAKQGFDPVPSDTFLALLDRLADAQARDDLWVAPFATIGAYWRASDIFQAAAFAPGKRGGTFTWTVPAHFPGGVKLRVRPGGEVRLYQKRKRLKRDKRSGTYEVSFDVGELRVETRD